MSQLHHAFCLMLLDSDLPKSVYCTTLFVMTVTDPTGNICNSILWMGYPNEPEKDQAKAMWHDVAFILSNTFVSIHSMTPVHFFMPNVANVGLLTCKSSLLPFRPRLRPFRCVRRKKWSRSPVLSSPRAPRSARPRVRSGGGSAGGSRLGCG